MRILALTSGAANMYCGSCLRDNALARELMRQGHEVTLVPMYTPTKTDEQNVSGKRVFFGGISIYLQQNVPLFRRLPGWVDRLWDSGWALRLATKNSIEVDPKSLGELTVSTLKGERGFQRKEIRKLIEWLRTEPKPDVIALPYTLLIGLAEPLKRELGAPVVCTLQGEDLFLEGLREPWRSECLRLIREQLPHVDRFIAVSPSACITPGSCLNIWAFPATAWKLCRWESMYRRIGLWNAPIPKNCESAILPELRLKRASTFSVMPWRG
jgi:hypothetical protein